MIPDKIYIRHYWMPGELDDEWLLKPAEDEQCEEYIRKDALLKWANATLAEAFIAGHNLCKEQMMKKTERIPKPELTWEDIAEIDTLILKANNEFAVDYSKEIRRKQFYTEVLNRFNKSKEEK